MSVRINGHNIQTLLNGFGIDHWSDDRYSRGGVGFYGGGER